MFLFFFLNSFLKCQKLENCVVARTWWVFGDGRLTDQWTRKQFAPVPILHSIGLYTCSSSSLFVWWASWNKRCKLQLELSNSPHRIATAALVQISRSRCTTLDAGVTLQEAAAWLLEVRTNVWRVSSVLTRVPFERRQIQQHNQLRQRKNQALSVDRLIIFITCFKLNIEIEVEGNTIAFATAASCNVRRLFRRTLQRDN